MVPQEGQPGPAGVLARTGSEPGRRGAGGRRGGKRFVSERSLAPVSNHADSSEVGKRMKIFHFEGLVSRAAAPCPKHASSMAPCKGQRTLALSSHVGPVLDLREQEKETAPGGGVRGLLTRGWWVKRTQCLPAGGAGMSGGVAPGALEPERPLEGLPASAYAEGSWVSANPNPPRKHPGLSRWCPRLADPGKAAGGTPARSAPLTPSATRRVTA